MSNEQRNRGQDVTGSAGVWRECRQCNGYGTLSGEPPPDQRDVDIDTDEEDCAECDGSGRR